MNRVPAIEPKIDCHVHVFDPARFPYAPDVFYKPPAAETATAQQLGYVLDAHGIRNALIVGPNSGYNLDNRCLLDALAGSEHDQLVDLRSLLVDSGVRLVFDHCGRPHPDRGVGQPGFQALLEMAATGRAAVKLSSLVKASAQPHPHADAWPFVRALVDAYSPQSLLWASDWPFLRAPARIDYGPLLALFEQLVPDEAARRAILWDTPRRRFGFTDN